MRIGYFAWMAGTLALAGCVSTGVDESALRSAADVRERAAFTRSLPLSRDIRALLARPLSADGAAQVALLNNRGLRAALEQVAIAEAGLASAQRLPNPTIEGAMRFHGGGRPELEVAGMIDLTELLLILSRGGAAASSVQAAKLVAIGELLDLSFKTREAFFDYQAALQALELRRTALHALSASSEVARRLREAGNITELAEASEQTLFHEARLEFQRAETAELANRERLNALMGLWGTNVDWRAEMRLPELPGSELALASLESEAVRRSLDLEIAKQRFTASAKRANVARAAGWLPELKAGVSAERDEEWAVGPAVELEVPLFYQGQAEVGLAKAEMRQLQNVYASTAVELRAAARTAASRLQAARDAAEYYRNVVLPLKQKLLDETQLQYNAMSVGVFQLLQAKRDQIQTAMAYVDQLREYWLARTRVEQLLAGRLPEPVSGQAGVTRSSTTSNRSGAGAH